MAEMTAAAAAMHLYPDHAVRRVARRADGIVERRPEARPARAALEFGVRGKQRLVAAGTGEGAFSRVARWLKVPVVKLCADGTYDGKPFRSWVKNTLGATVEVAKNLAQAAKKFVPAKKRWVVERTFAWFFDYRRLTIDYERLKSSSLAMIRIAMSALLLRRLC